MPIARLQESRAFIALDKPYAAERLGTRIVVFDRLFKERGLPASISSDKGMALRFRARFVLLVKRGTVKTVVLGNPVELSYLAVYAAQASVAGTLNDDATQAKLPA